MSETATAEIRDMIGPVLGALGPIAAAFTSVYEARCGTPSVEDLAAMDEVIKREINAVPAVTGAGVLIAEDLIPGTPRHIQWWMRSGDTLAPLRLNLDLTSIDVYDYLTMEVYTIPRQEGRTLVYGPYIDYLGIERYIFSASAPVISGGRFLGIAAADVPMADLEARFEKALRHVGADAVLVNDERRVIAANTSRWIAGHRLPRVPAAGQDGFLSAFEIGLGTGWTLGIAG